MPVGKGSPAAAAQAAAAASKPRKPEGKYTATGPIAGSTSPVTPSPSMAKPRASARGRQRGRAFGAVVPPGNTSAADNTPPRPPGSKAFGRARAKSNPKPRRGVGNMRTPY